MDEGTYLKVEKKGEEEEEEERLFHNAGTSILFLLKVFSGDVVKISTDIHIILAPPSTRRREGRPKDHTVVFI